MNKEDIIVKFGKYECYVELNQYSNKRLAISLKSAIDNMKDDLFYGTPIAMATVNMPDIKINEDQIIIKDYSENQGMFSALEKSGLVKVDEYSKEITIGNGRAVVVTKTEILKDLENATFSKKKIKP